MKRLAYLLFPICILSGCGVIEGIKVQTIRIFNSIVIAVAVLVIFLVVCIIRVHRRRITSGKEVLIDRIGIAITRFNKKGKGFVFLRGGLWTVYNTRDNIIKMGNFVKVIKVDCDNIHGFPGLKLFVEKISRAREKRLRKGKI